MALVIDADGHFAEPITLWDKYVDPSMRDKVRIAKDGKGNEWLMMGDVKMGLDLPARDPQATAYEPGSRLYSIGDTLTPQGLDQGRPRRRPYTQAHPGGFDAAQRLIVHDAEGIDGAVLFPSMGLFIAGISDPKVSAGACRAVNRFLADYCAVSPRELFGVATVPQQDPELAAQELRRAVQSAGFVAACLRPNPARDGRTIGDPSFDVLWSATQELDVPVCFHNALNIDLPQAGLDRSRSFSFGHAIVHPFEQMLAFGSLFEAGVFERFPRLRFGFMESNCGWAPFWLDRLTEHAERLGWMLASPPKRSPHQVFHDQCFIGCENEEPMLPYVQQRLGEDKVLWASDFPHFDALLPGLVSYMRERKDLTGSQRDAVLGGNACRFYKLDASAIARSRGTRQPRGVGMLRSSGD